MAEHSLKIGCCGFRRSRADYFKRFSLVEVQHTFYDPPKLDTLAGWREEAPDDFEFTIKAWQLVTHAGDSPTYKRLRRPLSRVDLEGAGYFRATETVDNALKVTFDCARALRAKKILFQCPARFTPDDENIENLRRFFRRKRHEFVFLWEPRGKWPEPLIQELCEELDLVHVVNPFKGTPLTRGLYYFRLHGRGGQQHYDRDALDELKATVGGLGQDTYVLFNNIRMLEDAEAFRRLAERSLDKSRLRRRSAA